MSKNLKTKKSPIINIIIGKIKEPNKIDCRSTKNIKWNQASLIFIKKK